MTKRNIDNKIKYTTINGITAGDLYDLLKYINEHSGGTATWGQIVGNILNQTDLIQYIAEHGGTTRWGQITGSILDQADLEAILRGLRNQINILDEVKADETALTEEIQNRQNADSEISHNLTDETNARIQADNTKQNIHDDNLLTTNKTIVGAINELASGGEVGGLVVAKTSGTETTGTISSIYKDINGFPIMEFFIGYQGMLNNYKARIVVAFDYINHTIIREWREGFTLSTPYEVHTEWNSYIDKFIVAIRSSSSTSDTRDIYIEFNEDATAATITFAKNNTSYIAESRFPR